MKFLKFSLVVVCLMVLTNCDKQTDEILINRLKVDIMPGSGMICSSDSDEGRTFEHVFLYKGFNKSNYKNCKSIIFTGSITACIDPNDPYLDTCYLEIYNLTDSMIIPQSTIQTTSIPAVWVESADLLDFFPNKDIDITLRLRNAKTGLRVGVYSASLYINF